MTYLEHDFNAYPELTNGQLEVFGLSSPHPQIISDFTATVVKVHDGDTVTLRCDFRDFDFPLRLADIDAPELSEGGEFAGDWLRARIEGSVVTILIDFSNRVDKYGRLLGRVLSRGLNVAEEMVSLALVKPFGRKKEGEVPALSWFFNQTKWS